LFFNLYFFNIIDNLEDFAIFESLFEISAPKFEDSEDGGGGGGFLFFFNK
jgi:hypothetical protein